MSDTARAPLAAGQGTARCRATVLFAGCLAVTLSTPALAQEATTERPPDDRWTFTMAPYLWATSLDGKTSAWAHSEEAVALIGRRTARSP